MLRLGHHRDSLDDVAETLKTQKAAHYVYRPSSEPTFGSVGLYGRGERIRTSDPLYPKQVRYQAAPRPEP